MAPFPIVGIGASAGGLPALTRLLENMPPAPGMALVVVLHLAPDVPSVADRLLQRATGMPVLQVRERVRLQPDHVYLVAPGRSLRIEDGHLVAEAPQCALGIPMTINIFLRTLGEAHGAAAIGVILSGMGSDGAAGLAHIKQHGGLTIAQLPDDAEESGMPQAAIDSGMVDFILPAARVAAKLADLRDLMRTLRHGLSRPGMAASSHGALDAILALLQARTGHDFRHYKPGTLLRRLERRMQVHGTPDQGAYLELLQQDPHEPGVLLQELLIGVTGFFHDRIAFDALDKTILPRLFQRLHDAPPAQPLRAWVAGCATGEEAYSLAMLLAEHAQRSGAGPALQVFATDIDERALAVARAGRYPDTIAADLAPQRLARFFVPDDAHFRVRQLLREHILFARHDLLHDSAFSNLDLISCRNVLIYLNQDVHRHVLEIFHSALKPGGYLFLGGAESADQAPDLFVAVEARHRLYRANPAAKPAQRPALPSFKDAPRQAAEAAHSAGAPGASPASTEQGERRTFRSGPRPPSLAELHQRALVRAAPPSLLVNARGDIVHASEHAAAFLVYGGGEPSTQVLALVLPALRDALRVAMFQAAASGEPAHSGPIRHARNGKEGAVRLAVTPLADDHAGTGSAPGAGSGPGDGMLLVCFAPVESTPAGAGAADAAIDADADAVTDSADPRIRELEGALLHARRDLRQTVERAETWSADLNRSNETLHATVEQLRMSIEDLETEREEMQSRNEELHTINAELQMRVEETAKANDDLSNLIASTDIATLFLDHGLRIQRYTPRVTRIFSVIPADVGRPLAHITNRLGTSGLLEEVAAVFKTLQPVERELRSTDGCDYIVRVHPYRTAYDRVEGVVMTFFDITRRRAAEQALQANEQRLAFLLRLSDALRTERDADAMAHRALRMLADEMGLDRCCIMAWTPDQDQEQSQARTRVTHQFGNDRVPPLPDVVPLSVYPEVSGAMPGGVAGDVAAEPGMRTRVAATLQGGAGRPAWAMLALCAAPRHWTRGEIALVEEAAGRTWAAIERVRAEAMAARAERRAEGILEHMGDAHSVLDREFRIVGVNAAAERLLGRKRATLLGRSHWDAFPGSVDAPVGLAFRRVIEQGVEQHLTHHYTGEGYDLHLEVDAYPTDEGGLAMFWRDVTERVRAELALRASEEKYRALFTEMDEAYAVVEVMADAAGRWTDFLFLEVNPAFMRHTGMPYPVGRTSTELLGTPNPRWAELYGRAAETGVAIRLEEAEMTLGRVFDLNIFRLDGEGSRRVAVLFTDISERKHTEAALRESEARFRALAEASPALIWQIDAGGALDYVNQRCLDVTGTSLEQLRGAGWHGVVHPDDAAGYLHAVARALREQAPLQQRVRLRRTDGGHHWFESHALPWHTDEGRFRGLVGISIDVDEAVQAEDALKTADRRKDEFLATLAHELRNPLAPISNALQFLRYPQGKRRADRLLAMVERQVRQMVRLVDDLMEVTRISRGKVDLRRAPVALADILDSAVETSQPAFEQKRQQLTVDAADASLMLDADKVRLTQVFANLLNNAARYTAPGGQAWVTVGRDGSDAVVTVRDTGVGIAPEQLPLIFEMFSQPHGRDGHTDSGLGIGLAMVRSLVELHGGAVQARSAGPGTGSEFVVRLPLYDRADAGRPDADDADAAARAADVAIGQDAAPLAGRRILVVDDNRDAADSLCQLLAARGADAGAVYDGRAALAMLDAAPAGARPHAILLDIGMPDLDGHEVARRIRRDPRTQGIRLIALSGWGQAADRRRSRACGFEHHLTKPADLDSLLRILTAR